MALPLYPLYPNASLDEFTTSLSINGGPLWDMNGVGKCIKELKYPNTKPTLLLPDIEYLRKFATYDLGISDMILQASLTKNLGLAKTINTQKTFQNLFQQATQPGMGLKPLEQTLLSSIFESQKPYFKVAQLFTESVIDIEDIIARIAILTSPQIPIKPFSVKSRKPIGNNGSFGSPKAMGYQNGYDIRVALNELKRLSKKGLNITIDDSGKSTIIPNTPLAMIGSDTKFDYFTLSTVYSTGVFNRDIKYLYQYIDLPADVEPTTDPLVIPTIATESIPTNIILGIFDSQGTPVNPNSNKLKWITQSPKWILPQAVNYPQAQNWNLISNVLYHWRYLGQIKIQHDSPGPLWQRLNYGDVMDFQIKDNQNSKYKKDDPITSFTPTETTDYQKFFDSKVDEALQGKNLSAEQAQIVRTQVTQIYLGPSKSQPGQTALTEHIQNLVQFSKLKVTPYQGHDRNDTSLPFITNFNKDNLVFKPMLFKIKNKNIWIDPETDYDYKIIHVGINPFSGNPPTNDQLYSKGRYGDGTDTNPQSYGYIERKSNDPLDLDNYYIIEGIKKTENNTDPTSNSGSGFYHLPDALGVIPVLINLAVKVFSQLIPEIQKMVSLLSNPANFLIDVITQKIKDPKTGFAFFTDEAMKIIKDLPNLSQQVKSGAMEVDAMIKIVSSSSLKNYIHVNRQGDWKFILSGEGTTSFLGTLFGLKVDFSQTQPIAPIIENSGLAVTGANFNPKCGSDTITNGTNPLKSNINTNNLSNDGTEAVNIQQTTSGDTTVYEDVSITYSTGEFVQGVDYKYIYVDQATTQLISEADNLAALEKNTTSSDLITANLEEAVRKYQTALESERSKDAAVRNKSLINLLMQKINTIQQKINISTQPIFKLLFGLVAMPIKIVLKIINCIMDFFNSLFDNPLTIPTKIADFLSFSWLINLLKPDNLLFLAGINFDPSKISLWSAAIAGKIKLEEIPLGNLQDFLSVAYQMILPEFTEAQFKNIMSQPFRILVPTLTLFQYIINAFIMLIWSIFGISSVLPPPLLCNKYDINEADLADLLSGLFKDNLQNNTGAASGDSYTFIYEVKGPDGVTRQLDAEALQKYIEDNQDVNFDFNNFKTIE